MWRGSPPIRRYDAGLAPQPRHEPPLTSIFLASFHAWSSSTAISSPAIGVTKNGRPLRIAVTARSVYPLHRHGGLERHVFDLLRNLVRRGAQVTLIAPPSRRSRPIDADADALFRHRN